MFPKRSSTVLLGLLLCAASAAAQVNVTLQLPFAQMPSRVSEWRENESLIRIVVQNTGREQYEGLMLSVELSKDGRRIARSRDGHPAQPRFSLSQGETRSLSWREVISEEAVEYEGSIRQQVAATGELPEGQYQLCIRILDAQLRPRSQQVCAPFTIVLPDPPQLLSPIGGAEVSPMPLLQWTPSNPTAPGLQYQVTVKVRYNGQTPAQAMASNPVRLQATVPTTSYQVPVTEQLGVDAADPSYAGHVWQVQALLNGRPYGRNRGASQIEWFVVPAMAVDPVKPSDGRPIAVVEWEVPYEEIRPGHPIKLQVPPIQEDTVLYVLRVRVPEKLSLQQLEQLRKNWAHEVRKEISSLRERQVLDDVGDMVQISNRTVDSTRKPGSKGISLTDVKVEVANRMVDSTRRPRGSPGPAVSPSYRMVDSTRKPGSKGISLTDVKVEVANRMVDSTRRPRGSPGPAVSPSYRTVDSTRKPGSKGISLTDVKVEVANRMVDSTRRPRGVPYILVDHGRAFHTHQDTFGVQAIYGRRDPVILGMGQDTAGAGVPRTYYGTYGGGFFLYGTPQDTAGAGVDRTRYTGGYFLYALPQDTTKPAELVDYYVPNGTSQDTTEPASAERINIKPLADRVVVEPAPAEERQIAYNAGVEGAIIVERRGNVLVVGNFTPTHIALPMPELELDPGEGPVCGIPGSLGQGEETVGSTARQTANGPRGTRGFLIVAVMPSVAYSEREAVIPSVAYSEREKAFRMMPPGGGAPVLWPNGNPPRDPDWPWVGVIGTPVLEGIDGEPGPGKPQNWCGTEYIWTGPPPKSPKELILTPVIPRPR
jgi:hypothetical protein